jgi:RNA polymerase sigma-70 factor, ECF subfamily
MAWAASPHPASALFLLAREIHARRVVWPIPLRLVLQRSPELCQARSMGVAHRSRAQPQPSGEMMRDDLEQTYRELRPYAFGIAYRMLGTVSEADDVVQDVFLRLGQATDEEIRSPSAYIATVTTRLAIDVLRSSRWRREQYVGTWLPEPLLDDQRFDGAAVAETADSLSMAFLVILESLSPVERAAFLLHDVFGYEYPQIATILDKSETNCRQIVSRSRHRIHSARPRFDTSREQRQRLAERFFDACQGNDMNSLVEMLAHDAVFYGDGGTKGNGVNRTIHGRDSIAKLLLAWFRQGQSLGVRAEPVWINHQPGAVYRDPEQRVINIISLDILDDTIQTVRSIINPDKLSHLGPLSPLGRRATHEAE